MKTEFEAKFLNIDFDSLRNVLAKFGAECTQPMRLMRRAIIETPDLKKDNAFVRLRDEGDKVTLTYKRFEALSVDGAQEHEIVVSDFREALALLSAAGLSHRSLQESKRETWALDGAEIVLDEWPWLNPYIEIEADSEQQVRETAEKLGFDWNDAVFGDVMAAYRAQYPHIGESDTVGNIANVKFGDPLPDLLKTL